MDDYDLLKMAGVSTTGMAIILLVYRIMKSVVGKKFISKCCDRKIEVGVDIAVMTPKDETVIQNPMSTQKAEIGLEIQNIKS